MLLNPPVTVVVTINVMLLNPHKLIPKTHTILTPTTHMRPHLHATSVIRRLPPFGSIHEIFADFFCSKKSRKTFSRIIAELLKRIFTIQCDLHNAACIISQPASTFLLKRALHVNIPNHVKPRTRHPAAPFVLPQQNSCQNSFGLPTAELRQSFLPDFKFAFVHETVPAQRPEKGRLQLVQLYKRDSSDLGVVPIRAAGYLFFFLRLFSAGKY
jgi:hypothetical protein